MLTWMLEPARRPGDRRRDAKQEDENRKTNQRQNKLPDKELATVVAAPHPSLADVAFPGNDAVEENKAHDAIDVKEEDEQNEAQQYKRNDECGEERQVVGDLLREARAEKMMRSTRVIRGGHIEMRVAAPTGAEFSCEKTNNGEAHPLRETKRLKELLFGVFKRGGNSIHGGNGQSTYLRQAECSMK